MKLKDILELENDDKILNFRYKRTGIPIWFYARSRLADEISNETIQLGNDNRKEKLKRYGKLLKETVRMIQASPSPKDKEILFITDSLSRTIQKNGKIANWQTDFYAEIYPEKSFVFETEEYCRNPYFPVSYQYFIVDKFFGLLAKILPEGKYNIKEINNFICFLEKNFKYKLNQKEKNNLKKYLKGRDLRAWFLKKYWKAILNKNRFKVIFCTEGSYVGYIMLFLEAKKQGIICAELQHGIITDEHFAYNYGRGIKNSQVYKKVMPDYLMTFGRGWNEYIHNNVPTIELGYTKNIGINHIKEEKIPERITFISHSVFFSRMCQFIEELLVIKNDLKREFYLRPHPSDFVNGKIKEYKEFCRKHDIQIDFERDLYKSLKKSKVVIGYESTVLYESTAMNIPTFLPKLFLQGHLNDNLFKIIKSPKEMADILDSPIEMKPQRQESFFDKNWRENYIFFMENIVNK